MDADTYLGHARRHLQMDEERASLLIVADDDGLRAGLVHQLVGHRYGLQVMSTGDEALQRLSSDRPHVVIVAIGQADALSLLERARSVCGRSSALIAILDGD